MGMATPANNHKNVNANDYGPGPFYLQQGYQVLNLNLALPFLF